VKAGFVRRLERLEATAWSRREPPSTSQPEQILRMLLAYHRGAWQEHEALFAGWGRALGYDLTFVLTEDLKTNPAAVAARHNEVLSEFLATHGPCLGVSTWEDAFPTIADLFEQIPEALRLRFGLRSVADAFPSG
jgi:hypothetical protein